MKNIQNILSFLAIVIATTFLNAQSTFTVGNTEYVYGEYYSTTGKPKVVRSAKNKKNFLKSLGYSNTPYGYEIDHIRPLSEGGTDDPSNMQLLTIRQHKAKTSRERARRYDNSFSTPKYTTNSTYNYSPSYSSSTNNKSFRTIYTGKNGGSYYLNSSGNKVYVKSEKQKSYNTYKYSTPSYSAPKYSSYSSSSRSRVIQTGSRGGNYYINSNGNKTYVKKN
jgi:hypothetical protein